MVNKLIVDWKEYNLIVEKLAVKIHESGFKPTMLIGIMRGGAPIIDVLSRIFKLKCSREMSSTVHDMGGRLLLCDDLSDTGVTLNKSIEWLKKYPPIKDNIESIKTAVLWKKLDSTFEPDYCADRLKDNPWIVQPFENYEEVKIEDLVKKHKK
jgi:hypoxanthine phosphoribosyltransferase